MSQRVAALFEDVYINKQNIDGVVASSAVPYAEWRGTDSYSGVSAILMKDFSRLCSVPQDNLGKVFSSLPWVILR